MKRFAIAAGLALVACGGAGPYGHAPKYVPTAPEEDALAGAKDYDPVMFAREPEAWRKHSASMFGVVTGRAPGPGGAAYVTVSVRRLEPRNLCSNKNDDDTCRVTISARDFGVAHALLTLRPEDETGEKSVGVGSLVRVVGVFGEEVDPNDGAPVLHGKFYRHWPRYHYVTNAASDLMRQ
ncbi:MAG: hypothetical protein KC657_00250 [Myxococcales bacterium]|nr:hypothetical protein [Myxococcales bacterium]